MQHRFCPLYYNARYGTVTITNTATLLQTGQLNWPIPVLCGLGVLLVAFGIIMILKKRKDKRV